MNEHQFEDVAEAAEFLTAGRAKVTVVSRKTGTRFTYRVSAPHGERDGNIRWVSLMTGTDNETSYSYLGYLKRTPAGWRYLYGGNRAKVDNKAPGALAFSWSVYQILENHRLPGELEVWHSGRCGRCGRTLTVPESIRNGIGPECIKHTHGGH